MQLDDEFGSAVCSLRQRFRTTHGVRILPIWDEGDPSSPFVADIGTIGIGGDGVVLHGRTGRGAGNRETLVATAINIGGSGIHPHSK